MRAHLLFLGCLAIAASAVRAQEPGQPPAQPIVETELDKSEVVPGQYATLRVTVLVPTWLPHPVEFPSMEAPNLRVRLPERSTGPTSRRVDGDEWSGVSRRYLISPMVAATFTIPAQEISVTYAIPGSTDTAEAKLQTDPVSITGVLPQGADGLDPFIAASGLTLTQDMTQPTTGLKPGQSVKRTVTATMEGASPIVLPRLMPEVQVAGIAVYPDEPSISEEDNRGVLSGTRVETVTFMAESGASGRVPGIELRWFNSQTGKVETARLDGFDISVEGPPATRPGDGRSTLFLAGSGLAVLAALAMLAWLIRRFWPRIRAAHRSRRDRRHASKAWAAREIVRAVRQRDYQVTLRALDEWASRPPPTDPACTVPARQALTGIGRTIYGRSSERSRPDSWRAVAEAVDQALRRQQPNIGTRLPPLNPR